ncbi:MAG: hypothetical protein ACHQD9_09600, partial [Chitinophagales bacterium]
ATVSRITSMHFYGWEKGLKTGMYYLRTKAATDAVKFTVEKEHAVQPIEAVVDAPPMSVVAEEVPVYATPVSSDGETAMVKNDIAAETENYTEGAACTLDENGNCLMCGS